MRLRVAILALMLLLVANNGQTATITDLAGRVISVERPFQRVISLYPAHTENLASLGLDKEIIGIANEDDHPGRLLDRPRFSYRSDPERFIAARPDLVLVRPMIDRAYPQFITQLEQAGIVVVSLQPTSVEEIFDYWRTLALLVGKGDQAEVMIEDFQQESRRIHDLVRDIPEGKRPRVYLEAIHEKMKTFAPQSIATYVLAQAGGRNAAADAEQVRKTNIAYYGKEQILARGEEIDLFIAQHGRMNPVTVESIHNEPGFQAIKAVRSGQVHLIEEQLLSRPTMRILEGMRRMAALLYPELSENITGAVRDGK